MNKKIVIIGGGTAGWLTALIAKRFYPKDEITLVESEDIGILGAGEGTVPHFAGVLEFLNIPISDVVKECDATLKLGIKFNNWNGDGKSYFHNFFPYKGLNFESFDELHLHNVLPIHMIGQGSSLNEVNFFKILAENHKVPFTKEEDGTLKRYGDYALHFNARLLAKFLRKKAEEIGIKRIEGKLKHVVSDSNNDIVEIVLDNDVKIPLHFIFDCSGFARIFLGGYFKNEWICYKKHLPLDTALPFFIEHTNDTVPETEAIAMKYGWIWKIPVQGRYGCGYVFDSSHINEEEAKKEVEEYFGQEITSPKTFRFSAGTYKDTLVQNCMAVGLAQSFFEPLEATSIWISCLNLISFFQMDGVNKTNKMKDEFNKLCLTRNENVMEFIYFHYLTKRKDSDFWINFKNKTEMPKNLDNILMELNNFPSNPLSNKLFANMSWLVIAEGLDLLDRRVFNTLKANYGIESKVVSQLNLFISDLNTIKESCMNHKDFLNYLKEFYK